MLLGGIGFLMPQKEKCLGRLCYVHVWACAPWAVLPAQGWGVLGWAGCSPLVQWGQAARQTDSALSSIYWLKALLSYFGRLTKPPFNIAPRCIAKLFIFVIQKSNIGSTKNSTTQPNPGAAEGSEGIQFTGQGWTLNTLLSQPELYQRPLASIRTRLGHLKR